MTFERPWLLLTQLVLPAAAALYVVLERRRARYAVRFTNVTVLAPLVERRSWRRYVPPALLLLALAALAVAVARPHVRTSVARERATVVLVLDVSRSMEAKDVRPTRLRAAQRAVRAFLDRAPSKLRVGMVAFAGEPYVAAPATTNHALVRESLRTLDQFASFGGTAIGDALARAVDLGHETLRRDERGGDVGDAQTASGRVPNARGLVSILFLSDGAQRRGILPPLEGAQRAKNAGMPVYTVALGTLNGTIEDDFGFGGGGRIPVPPDRETLRAIARLTGGEYFTAASAASASAAYEKLGSSLGRKRAPQEVTYGFAAAASALLVAAGLLSGLWSPRFP